MAIRVNNNIASITANRNLARTTLELTKSLERLSSGLRINRAADDASGLAISQKFRAQIAALGAASRNAAEAASVLQVAEGGMEQAHGMLTRLKELATQSASSNSNGSRAEIDAEADKLVAEIDRIANSTQYNGVNLLNGYGAKTYNAALDSIASLYDFNVDGAQAGTYSVVYTAATNQLVIANDGVGEAVTLTTTQHSYKLNTMGISFKITGGLTATTLDTLGAALDTANISVTNVGSGAVFQIGDDNVSTEQLAFSISSVTQSALGLSSLDLSTQSGAQAALGIIDTAVGTVNSARGGIGANMNRLSYASANLMSAIENLTASESVIRDADMAEEMSKFTKNQILQQSGIAALAQANALPQAVLALLRA